MISAALPPAIHRTPPLWQLLLQAARLVRAVRQGRSLTVQLESVDAQLRPGVQALTFHALRWLGLAEGVRQQLAPRVPPPRPDALLCTALTLLAADTVQMYSPFVLVDQAVEAAKRDVGTRASAGLVNACLRRFLRERDTLLRQAVDADPVARWNYPRWWVDRLQQDYPRIWMSILEAAQQPAPMVLRVNARRNTTSAYLGRLTQKGIVADQVGPTAIRLARACSVSVLPGFETGDVSVQSAAAQLAAPLLLQGLPQHESLRILDACAAPGGKTAHLLELAPRAHVTALEVDVGRSRRIEENLSRLGLQADVRVADAAETGTWWGGELYDAILLDAPCSASGIVSRHPDVRWLRREADIARLASQQDRLLGALWPLLARGGRLLYCTCSVFRQEGEERIRAFVARNSDAVTIASPGHLRPQYREQAYQLGENGECDDGFYYALLAKHPA